MAQIIACLGGYRDFFWQIIGKILATCHAVIVLSNQHDLHQTTGGLSGATWPYPEAGLLSNRTIAWPFFELLETGE
jgi:hypothetical protein